MSRRPAVLSCLLAVAALQSAGCCCRPLAARWGGCGPACSPTFDGYGAYRPILPFRQAVVSGAYSSPVAAAEPGCVGCGAGPGPVGRPVMPVGPMVGPPPAAVIPGPVPHPLGPSPLPMPTPVSGATPLPTAMPVSR